MNYFNLKRNKYHNLILVLLYWTFSKQMAQQHNTLYFLIKVEKNIDFQILHTGELFENVFVLHILDGMHNHFVVLISQTVTPNTFFSPITTGDIYCGRLKINYFPCLQRNKNSINVIYKVEKVSTETETWFY